MLFKTLQWLVIGCVNHCIGIAYYSVCRAFALKFENFLTSDISVDDEMNSGIFIDTIFFTHSAMSQTINCSSLKRWTFFKVCSHLLPFDQCFFAVLAIWNLKIKENGKIFVNKIKLFEMNNKITVKMIKKLPISSSFSSKTSS